MFPLRLRLLVVLCATIVILSRSGDALSATDLIIASDICCKTGLSLESCTEESINQTSHNPPTGFCRSAIKLCCLIKQKIPICDSASCAASPSKHKTCCYACRLGEQMAMKRQTCVSVFANHKNPSIDVASKIISECCHRRKRQRECDLTPPENLLSCETGFYYNRKNGKCEDINECEIVNNGCESSQDCKNLIGSYTCQPRSICKSGYKFTFDELQCKPDIPCELVEKEAIQSSWTRLRAPDAIIMASSLQNITIPIWKKETCKVGFKYNKKNQTCVDVDECAEHNPCDFNLRCFNTEGSYFCQCRNGYELIEHDECVDIDECRLVGKNVCDHFCVNRQGYYLCHCRRGFQLDPTDNSTCLDRNECLENKTLCSHSCRNVRGSYRCGCPKGYRLAHDKKTCEDINECVERKGVCENRVCNNLIGSYVCYKPNCPEGFKVSHFTTRNDFNKCVRKHCLKTDVLCQKKPKYLIFRNVTLAANMKLMRGGVVLHNINTAKFKFPVEIEISSSLSAMKGKGSASTAGRTSDFGIITQPSKVLVKLVKSLQGPQRLHIIVNVLRGSNVVESLTINLNILNSPKFISFDNSNFDSIS